MYSTVLADKIVSLQIALPPVTSNITSSLPECSIRLQVQPGHDLVGGWVGELPPSTPEAEFMKDLSLHTQNETVFFQRLKQTSFSPVQVTKTQSMIPHRSFLVQAGEGTDPKRVWFSVSRWNDFMTVASAGGGKTGCGLVNGNDGK
jgi:hypothetical protein